MSCRSKQQYHVKLNIKLSHIRAKNQINSIIFDFTFYRWSESVLKYQAFVLQVYYLCLIALSRFHMPVCHLLFTLIFSYVTPLFTQLNKIIITVKSKTIQSLLSCKAITFQAIPIKVKYFFKFSLKFYPFRRWDPLCGSWYRPSFKQKYLKNDESEHCHHERLFSFSKSIW